MTTPAVPEAERHVARADFRITYISDLPLPGQRTRSAGTSPEAQAAAPCDMRLTKSLARNRPRTLLPCLRSQGSARPCLACLCARGCPAETRV